MTNPVKGQFVWVIMLSAAAVLMITMEISADGRAFYCPDRPCDRSQDRLNFFRAGYRTVYMGIGAANLGRVRRSLQWLAADTPKYQRY